MVEFSFGMPVGVTGFYNRETELNRLVFRLGTINRGIRNDIAIIGPRRVGKSSLTAKMITELAKQGINGVKIDCEGLTPIFFLKQYGNAVIKKEAEQRNIAQNLESSLKQGVTATVLALSELLGRVKAIEIESPLADFISLRIELEKKQESELQGEELFNFFTNVIEFPEKLKQKYVIVFDEFQETSGYKIIRKGDFHSLFRRAIQYQKNVGYVYTGSSIGMMREIFGNQDNPLAGNADIIELGPFSREHSISFLEEGLNSYAKQISTESTIFAAEKTGGFPAYLNWIGLRLSEKSQKTFSKNDVKAVYDEMLIPTSPIYQAISKQLSKLGPKTRKIIKTIAQGIEEAAEIERETSTKNIYVYLKRLDAYGLIKKENGKYTLIDPVMQDGFKINAF